MNSGIMVVSEKPLVTSLPNVPGGSGGFGPVGDETTKIGGMPVGGFAIGLASAVIGMITVVVPLGICYHKIRAKRNRRRDVELNDMSDGHQLDEGNARADNLFHPGAGPAEVMESGNALTRFLGRLRG